MFRRVGRVLLGQSLVVLGELVLILLIDYTPIGNAIFGAAPLSWRAWVVVLPFGLAMLPLEEWRKRVVRARETPIAAAHADRATENHR